MKRLLKKIKKVDNVVVIRLVAAVSQRKFKLVVYHAEKSSGELLGQFIR